MKEKIILLLIIMLIGSCESKESDSNIYLRTDFEVDIADEIYTQTYPVNYNLIQDGKNVKLILQSDQDTIIYEFKEDNKNGLYFRNGKQEPIILLDKKEYRINGGKHLIYKYGLNMVAIDGCSTHFWSPEFGILLIHSATWGGFSQIKSKNELVEQLSSIIMNDKQFYEGC